MKRRHLPHFCFTAGITTAGIIACMIFVVSCYRNPANTVTLLSSRPESQEKPIRMAFLTNMQGGEHWGNMKSGARFARSMHGNMTIEFYAPINEADYHGQTELLQQVVDADFDALVISSSHATYAASTIQQALAKGMMVVTVDNDILAADGTSLAKAHVGTDSREVGKKAAMKGMELAPQVRKALVVASVPESTSMMEKTAAITEIFSESGIEFQVIFCHADATIAYGQVKAALESPVAIDIIIALEEYAAHGVADALAETSAKARPVFIGSGNSRYQLNLLETGRMDALVVENSFTMGYLAVEAAASLAGGRNVVPVPVEFAIVTPLTMWEEHHQRLLFPLTN
ncbi:substrate-binding domain-containing protein [Parasphaerochaeta coccoides]|uniref:Periplasmic binding protein domain-containing protein n=1 Tax=Parasphaerochaeta coccoides (strain ATCC BAA-1237 / DSM 17374 / SPN1) TaxID=760011 RepID=F4GHL8_PARC1|nr:substrate-binding domain-containing protein [Parasphaerochaeta coccoides]AEC02607.1 hypothetical protein Spico_1403 [Parasphaerochaeta coccoides DSM 17374]